MSSNRFSGQKHLTRRQLLGYTGALAGSIALMPGTGAAAGPVQFRRAFALAAAQEDRFGGDFTAAMQTAPPSLDLMVNVAAATREATYFSVESLVTYGAEFAPIPMLAEKWDVSDDGKTYTFALRKGVKFHNGKEMTADDVIASTDRFLEVTNRKLSFAIIESYEAVDDYTVAFHLSEPRAALLDTMAFPVSYMGILPREIIENKGEEELTAEELVGTGPYQLDEWVPDQHLKYSRFEDYQTKEGEIDGLGGDRVPYFDTITLEVVPEAATRQAGLETAEYDYSAVLPSTSYPSLEASESITPQIFKYASFGVVTFNHTDAITGNLKFRQAVLALMNMENIGMAVSNGREEFFELDPSLYFPNTPWHNDEIGADLYNQGDVEKAKSLLEESGYNGEEIVLITNRNYDYMYKTIVTLDESLRSELGVTTRVDVLDWPGQTARTQGTSDWHIAVTGLLSAPTFGPEGYEAYLVGTSSLGHYSNPDTDAIFAKLSTATTVDERLASSQDIQRMFYEDVPMIRTTTDANLYATNSNIQGYEPWYLPTRFWNCWREDQ